MNLEIVLNHIESLNRNLAELLKFLEKKKLDKNNNVIQFNGKIVFEDAENNLIYRIGPWWEIYPYILFVEYAKQKNMDFFLSQQIIKDYGYFVVSSQEKIKPNPLEVSETQVIYDLLKFYGEPAIKFLKDYNIGNLSNSNCGFKNDKPIIFDPSINISSKLIADNIVAIFDNDGKELNRCQRSINERK